MTLESESDRLALLKGDDEETFQVDGQDIIAVFDAPYSDPLEVESSAPQLYARTSDLDTVGAVHGSTVIRLADASAYKIRNVQPDSEGMTLLRLEAQ